MNKPTAKKNFKLTGEYTSSVAAYGEPPKGFRFLKVGEKSDPSTDWYWCWDYWTRETTRGRDICEAHVPFIRRLPEDAPVEESAPPKYTGPAILWGDSLTTGIAKAGPAPKGWSYVAAEEKGQGNDFILVGSQWEPIGCRYIGKIGRSVGEESWPVIRRAAAAKAVPAPEVTIKSLLARVEALERKLSSARLAFDD